MKQLVLSASVVVVLSFAACSSDGSESVERPVAESIVDDTISGAVATKAPPVTLLPASPTTLPTATAVEPNPLLANELEPVATSPLTARSSAMGVWTGTEVLVVGGEPKSTCPPGGDCTAPDYEPLADGAAYDPETATWRTLADAPLSMSGNARPVVVGELVYVLVLDASYRPGGGGGLLEYDISSDT